MKFIQQIQQSQMIPILSYNNTPTIIIRNDKIALELWHFHDPLKKQCYDHRLSIYGLQIVVSLSFLFHVIPLQLSTGILCISIHLATNNFHIS